MEAKIQRLAGQVGIINKPRYVTYDERLCARDRQGVPGCRACLDACPADAIHVEAGGIAIDPYLCRGCGTCALVCPTGAARCARPKPRVTLQAIADALDAHLGPAASPPRPAPPLVIHAGDPAALGLPDGIPELTVLVLGSVGMELWFAALALGASRVLLLRSGLLTATGTRLIEQQVDLARRLLRALGEAPERIRFVTDPQRLDWGGLPNPWPPAEPGRLAVAEGKRHLLLAALGHLEEYLPSSSSPFVLERGSPFGAIAFDSQRCTLCHACVGVCPTRALHNRVGALTFPKGDCVQCGLCVNACPEHALSVEPRLDSEALVARAERTLKAASEIFPCVVCGAPVGPRSLVEGSMAHVRDHPMYQGEGLRLLQMCQDCRQKAILGLSGANSPAFSQPQGENLR